MNTFTREELTRLLGQSGEQLDELVAAGLIDPEGDGQFDDLDLVRAQLVREYCERGYDPRSLAEAIRDGSEKPFLGDILFDSGPIYTVEQLAEKADVEPEQIAELRTALGLAGDRLHDRHLRLIEAFKLMVAAGFPWEAIVQGARVFGDSLRRIADTEARLVHVHLHERLLAAGVPEREVKDQVFGLQESVAPLIEPLILHIHEEHALRAYVEDAYLHLADAAPISDTIGSVEAAVAFVDVTSFTQMTAEKGDRYAESVMHRLDNVIRHDVLAHDGKVVKEIGDAFMLAFRDPVGAVRFATDVMAQVARESDMPTIRVGINCGRVLFHWGDYTGSVVNVASRVTSAGTGGQILVTAAVAEAARDAGFRVEEIGARLLRGADEATILYRVATVSSGTCAVCGTDIIGAAAAQISRAGVDYQFCSEDCLRRFFDDERQTVST